jgi:hypothetical protein
MQRPFADLMNIGCGATIKIGEKLASLKAEMHSRLGTPVTLSEANFFLPSFNHIGPRRSGSILGRTRGDADDYNSSRRFWGDVFVDTEHNVACVSPLARESWIW